MEKIPPDVKAAARANLAKSGASVKYRQLVTAYLDGASKQQAALEAGLPETAWQSPLVAAALEVALRHYLATDLAPRALLEARRMIDAKDTPSGTKATLILGVLDRAGYGARSTSDKARDSRDVSQMTPAELRAEMDKLQAEIDRNAIDITPDDGTDAPQTIDFV